MKISLLPLVLFLCAITAQAQLPKKPAKPYIVANVPGVPGPERSALEKFRYEDDEASVLVTRLNEAGILRVSITVGFKMATSERSQSRQEAMMLGAEYDATQMIIAEQHHIVISGPKTDRLESCRVIYYAGTAKIASMDAKTSLMGDQAFQRALRFFKLAHEHGERTEIR